MVNIVKESLKDILLPKSQEEVLAKLDSIRDELKNEADGFGVLNKLSKDTGNISTSNMSAWEWKNLVVHIIDDATGESEDYILAKLVEYFYDIME